MGRLKFYNIDDAYINYLYQFDNKVPYNKNKKRPYIGVIIEIDGIEYFAPLFSPKVAHKKYSDNPTYMKIGKNYGIIRFNTMIPVVGDVLTPIDFNTIKDIKYRNLLIAQNNFIQQNTDKIRNTAKKLYKMVTVDKKKFFVDLSCDFKMLEAKVGIYKVNENTEKSNMKKDIEITCEVFEEISTIDKALKNAGFKYVEEFILDDIYMNNENTKEFGIQDGKITDTLIIRLVNENDKKIICKRRKYDNKGFEISTEKSVLKIETIEEEEKYLNVLGYTRFLRMIDKNYMYESENYIAYIQEVQDLGIFLEIEAKDTSRTVEILIELVKNLGINIGTKFDVRKAELLYKRDTMSN